MHWIHFPKDEMRSENNPADYQSHGIIIVKQNGVESNSQV